MFLFDVTSCQNGTLSIPNWVWIIVGIVCVIFLVVGGIAVYYRFQLKKNRKMEMAKLRKKGSNLMDSFTL